MFFDTLKCRQKNKCLPLATKLIDGTVQLGNGSTNVGELDDVSLGSGADLAQLGQVIRNSLVSTQMVGELSQNAGTKTDVALHNINTSLLSKSLDDGEEGVSGKGRSLIGLSVNDSGSRKVAEADRSGLARDVDKSGSSSSKHDTKHKSYGRDWFGVL